MQNAGRSVRYRACIVQTHLDSKRRMCKIGVSMKENRIVLRAKEQMYRRRHISWTGKERSSDCFSYMIVSLRSPKWNKVRMDLQAIGTSCYDEKRHIDLQAESCAQVQCEQQLPGIQLGTSGEVYLLSHGR